MLDYINDEAAMGRRIIAESANKLESLSSIIDKQFSKISRVLIIATGSSYNASLAAKLFFEDFTGAAVEIREPFQFSEFEEVPSDVDLVLAVTQRGSSLSTINAVKKIKTETDIPVLVITSVLDSPITKLNVPIIDMNCGLETMPYSTKGVTATMLTLMLIAIEIAGNYNDSFNKEVAINKLKSSIDSFESVIRDTIKFYEENKKELDNITRYSFIGYGSNLGTVKEAETKMTETIRVPSQGFELEAYMHGPIFELKRQYGVMHIHTINSSNAYKRARDLENFVDSYCEHNFIITNDISRKGQPKVLLVDTLNLEEVYTPLLMVIPFQVLSYLISFANDINLEKSVYSDFRVRLGSKVGEVDKV
ncbi:SIS domain-containing protein [Trichococcus flocculiformis]|uniref:SIS domain-containing protein n=1 Tax=Trichococcus flocculiformis TaxID=82803 RepID=UPI003DA409A2